MIYIRDGMELLEPLFAVLNIMDQTVLTELADNPESSKYSWETDVCPAIKRTLQSLELNDLSDHLESFSSCPFTIQRIAELLLHPHSHTQDRDKYKRALEKCLKVTSSITMEKVDDMMEL